VLKRYAVGYNAAMYEKWLGHGRAQCFRSKDKERPKTTTAKSKTYSPNSKYDPSICRTSLFGTSDSLGVKPVERLIPARNALMRMASNPICTSFPSMMSNKEC